MFELLAGLFGTSIGFITAGLTLHNKFSKYIAELEREYERKLVNLDANHDLALEVVKSEQKELAEVRIREFQEAFNKGFETKHERPAFSYGTEFETGASHVSDEELYFQELEEQRKANGGLPEEEEEIEERKYTYY